MFFLLRCNVAQINIDEFSMGNIEKHIETYWVHGQISKIELFLKIVNDWKLLTYFAKSPILDVWLVSKCTSGMLSKAHKVLETAVCVDISQNVKVKKKICMIK